MQQTANFGLSQYELTDRILMEKFNSDNQKIDTALKSNADAVAAAGNCSLSVQTYTGTGTYGSGNPTQITFAKKPRLFFVKGPSSLMVGSGDSDTAFCVLYISNSSWQSGTYCGNLSITWSGNTASFYHTQLADWQFNVSASEYQVFALCAE